MPIECDFYLMIHCHSVLFLFFIGILPPFITRPVNVPEGAHIQWEIELLGFETPKVLLRIVLLNSCYFYGSCKYAFSNYKICDATW